MIPGKLKIYLGYAAGVGKTYQMLEDAQELKRQGHDVAIGYFEPHGRADTIAKTEGLELIPRRIVEYRGAVFEEMDTDAVLARHPEICVVDEFPHTNVPGSRAEPNVGEDVIAMLEAGIGVLTTMNIQHLESLNDQVWQISGVRVRETDSGLGGKAGRTGCDGGCNPRCAGEPAAARRCVLAGKIEEGSGEFLSGIDTGCPARTSHAADGSTKASPITRKVNSVPGKSHRRTSRVSSEHQSRPASHCRVGVPQRILILVTADPRARW